MPSLHRFAVSEGGTAESLVSGLQSLRRIEREPTGTRRVVVYDTFDWRIFRDGGRIDQEDQALVWRDRRSGQERGRWPLPRSGGPRRVRDLPPGPVTDRLARVVDVRALIALAEYDSSVTTLRLLDDESKTVARILVEEARLLGDAPVALGTVVEVVALRGYEGDADRLAAQLAARDDLVAGAADLADRAVAAAGHRPGSYSSKMRLALDRTVTAEAAWIEVLRALHQTMVVNRDGLVADIDPEFLHDFRVAVRRTRSVLGEARGVLPEELLAHYRREFKWLGDITTPTRDFDVYRLTLPAMIAELAPSRREALSRFAAFVDRRQAQAHRAMVRAMASPRFTELEQGWSRYLAAPDPDSLMGSVEVSPADPSVGSVVDPDADPSLVAVALDGADRDLPPPPLAHRPAVEVAAQRTWKSYRRVIRHGRSIDDASPPSDLHELRKDAKRLRYLLECFGSLFPPEPVERMVKELKGLQEVLGDYQDAHVQVDSLDDFAQQMLDEGGTSAATVMAMGHLVDQLDRRQRDVRRRFSAQFARFDSPAVRRRFRSTFPPRHDDEGSS